MPVHVLPGNHDDRAGLRAALPRAGDAGDPGDPFRYAVDVGALRLVVCDTTQPGRPDGRLDGAALDGLRAAVADAGDRPVVVAMHHPPVTIGIAVLDEIGIAETDRRALGALLRGMSAVRGVVAGHVHRASFGTLDGCPVVTCPSTHLQARMELHATEIVLAPGPPAIALHVLLADGRLVSHLHPVGGP